MIHSKNVYGGAHHDRRAADASPIQWMIDQTGLPVDVFDVKVTIIVAITIAVETFMMKGTEKKT